MRDHTDDVEQDAFARGVSHLLQISGSLELKRDAIAAVVHILQTSALGERRHVVRAGYPKAAAIEEIPRQIADRCRTAAHDLDPVVLAGGQGAAGTTVTVSVVAL